MTKIKLCEDEQGFLFAVALPDGTEDCESGPILGPPEGLNKPVHNQLAKAGIYTAFDLIGKRATVLKILKGLAVPSSYARTVYHVYQKNYFGEDE